MKLVKLERAKVREAIRGAASQEKALERLFGFVFGPAEKIKGMEGVPKVSEATHAEITTLFKKFDDKENPGHSAGGLVWIQYGFQSGEGIPDWFVDIDDVNITS